ncbi:HNH endonuclease [Salegentibacter maritimus]|uniref:HNH endonuclease n=1 Tax=Salegentibacter maritimus TaxID=2794347 RepID=A0ABS0TJU0_9FLAO|nr:HNH endonuclease signature motif containing protein [Salegentibacter maritimus]MBI6120897.1 HNH endonuclease [Salegentibacter maritimus]
MFAISPTDLNWFTLLKNQNLNSKINLWTPTPWNVTRLPEGDRLYFMLKSPIRKIGGFGEFIEYKNMSINEAWNKFGFRNGCSSKQELVDRLNKYKGKHSKDDRSVLNSEIGCIILNNAEFWDEEDFKDLENYNINFSRYIVKIKYFEQLDTLSNDLNYSTKKFELIPTSTEKLKKARLITERRGSGVFRARITRAYSNQCCISGDKTVELLEAAHIQPYLNNDSNHVSNGLLLRVDFHRMYDNGLIYIDQNFLIHVSPEVKSNYYQSFHGKKISLPNTESFAPSKEALLTKKFEYRNE